MTPDEISNMVTKILKDLTDHKQESNENPDDIKIKLSNKYKDFSMSYPVIFLSVINGDLDIGKFNEFVTMASNVKQNKITQHDASVKIGSKLVNEYVKPKLKNITP